MSLQSHLEYGIKIIAHCSGHMIGGTVWQIIKNDQSIIYAIDFNHKKEKLNINLKIRLNNFHGNRHLNSFKFNTLQRPIMMITSSDYAFKASVDINERNNTFLSQSYYS